MLGGAITPHEAHFEFPYAQGWRMLAAAGGGLERRDRAGGPAFSELASIDER